MSIGISTMIDCEKILMTTCEIGRTAGAVTTLSGYSGFELWRDETGCHDLCELAVGSAPHHDAG
jgi:hypothetical protein